MEVKAQVVMNLRGLSLDMLLCLWACHPRYLSMAFDQGSFSIDLDILVIHDQGELISGG